MNVKEVIEIDFIYFFKTGNFDCLILGQTKEWVLNNFPNPDGKYNPETNKVFSIWTYGNIELHFEKEVLFLIYSDSLDNLNGGDFLKLNKWIFDDISKLNLLYVLSKLNEHNIDYKKMTDNLGVLLRLKSGVELTFESINNDDNLISNNFQITSFGLVAENPRRWK